MASLKEVRARIASVTSTRKITSAMRMVSAAKLRRAQDAVGNYLPYEKSLSQILGELLTFSSGNVFIPLSEIRTVQRVAIVAISSNSSLCGAFNGNIIKKLDETLTKYQHLDKKNIQVFALGKKIADASKKMGFPSKIDFQHVIDKPDYNSVLGLSNQLMDMFLAKEVDEVILIFNHFKNAAVQQVQSDLLLPLKPTAKQVTSVNNYLPDYILEPNTEVLIQKMIPKAVRNKLYRAVLDSVAGEHGARTTAMQIATDNAADLINDLKLKYNKARQEAITKEIIDIVGGAECLR